MSSNKKTTQNQDRYGFGIPVSPFFVTDENNSIKVWFNGNRIGPGTLDRLVRCKDAIDWVIENFDDRFISRVNKEADAIDAIVDSTLSDSRGVIDNGYGFIYVYKQGNLYKIGRSKSEDCRFKKYITENPNPVILVTKSKVPRYRLVEAALHDSFSEKRHSREWYRLERSDISYIKRYLKSLKSDE